MTNLSKLRAALLGSGAILALAAGPAFASETDDLRAQIDTLQARLDQLEKQPSSTEAKPAVAPVDAVVGGDFPGSFKLPGSDTSYAIHGYTKLDYVMDIDNAAGSQSVFFVSTLPANNVAAGNQGFRSIMFPHQSRLIFESRTPTNYGPLVTHIEGDFRGNFAGNDNVLPDNKGGFRIRNAYGQLGPVRAGNDYDLLDPLFFASPEKVVFFSPAGPTDAKRTVLIRYSQPSGVGLFQQGGNLVFSGEITLPGSESGNSSVANGTAQMFLPGGTNAATTTVSDQQLEIPNLNAGVDYGGPWGHTRLAGQLRFFRLNDGKGGDVGGTNHTVDEVTYIGQIAAGVNLGHFLPSLGKDKLMGIANWGSGAAGQENGIDDKESITVLNFGAAGQRSFTNPVWGVSGGVQHWWTPNLRSNAAYYFSKIHLSHDIAGINPAAGTNTTDTQAFLVNLIWSPVKQVNFGAEYEYGERHGLSDATGYTAHGTANRIQIGLQYLF